MKQKIKKVFKKPRLSKRVAPDAKLDQAIEGLPRITNETVAEHREEMLSSARKYIYPLQHTKKRVVKVSVSLLVLAIVLFFAYVFVSLYKLQSTSTFLYGVTRVLPLPVAKAGNAWVSYESYLFELRHFMHYKESQQQVNFHTDSGKQELAAFKKQALEQVINDAYTKQIAAQHHISVSNSDVNDAVTLLREQNRLGSSDQQFADVLKEFWGWSVDDFKRELRQQLLAQKVIATLGTATNTRANQAQAELKSGKKFEAVAKKYSDDAATKANGGEYSVAIDQNNRDLAPQVVDELFKLKPGQVSSIIDTGYTLEIVKVISAGDNKVHAAHIAFNYQGIATYIKPQETKYPAHRFISVK
jgi:parvulin-like peptidyl-prolyl isomerase